MELDLNKPPMVFGEPYPREVMHKLKYLLRHNPSIAGEKNWNLLVVAYWRMWDGWTGTMDDLERVTPVETITRARRECGF